MNLLTALPRTQKILARVNKARNKNTGLCPVFLFLNDINIVQGFE